MRIRSRGQGSGTSQPARAEQRRGDGIDEPVRHDLAQFIPATAELGLYSVFVAAVLGIAFRIVADRLVPEPQIA